MGYDDGRVKGLTGRWLVDSVTVMMVFGRCAG